MVLCSLIWAVKTPKCRLSSKWVAWASSNSKQNCPRLHKVSVSRHSNKISHLSRSQLPQPIQCRWINHRHTKTQVWTNKISKFSRLQTTLAKWIWMPHHSRMRPLLIRLQERVFFLHDSKTRATSALTRIMATIIKQRHQLRLSSNQIGNLRNLLDSQDHHNRSLLKPSKIRGHNLVKSMQNKMSQHQVVEEHRQCHKWGLRCQQEVQPVVYQINSTQEMLLRRGSHLLKTWISHHKNKITQYSDRSQLLKVVLCSLASHLQWVERWDHHPWADRCSQVIWASKCSHHPWAGKCRDNNNPSQETHHRWILLLGRDLLLVIRDLLVCLLLHLWVCRVQLIHLQCRRLLSNSKCQHLHKDHQREWVVARSRWVKWWVDHHQVALLLALLQPKTWTQLTSSMLTNLCSNSSAKLRTTKR